MILATANVAEAKRGVNARQARQQSRILNGVGNGKLTGREFRKLEKKEAKLARQEARMRRSGGGLSNKERGKLEKEENHLSRDIYKQKHDGQERP